ncbi:hypothetical protein K6U06_04645 [Acidiferrimicrobium sp. IK]|uniref:hypothetical protein n=1 Tax=Acidiferrimicrobium sp. IK TaxID=2871700 RepID=UPI0021CB670F|nr:hypothetical protein [Acidiferrimicrobium sp. IK]MCU4183637.1 hypothetical protein [Acidiferrimicrobium sp. IK]
MAANKWLDRTQPQTLYIATMIMYINAAFDLIGGVAFSLFPIGAVLTIGSVAAGLGIANEKKAGYWLGVAIALLPLVLIATGRFGATIVSLLFEVALVALLLHPQSRSYQKTWFK